MQSRFNRLRSYDKDLFTALSDAAWRVESCLDLRASANHVSPRSWMHLGEASIADYLSWGDASSKRWLQIVLDNCSMQITPA
ncbi:hypothetical protein FQZ97_508030 [compost metagenome]